MYDKFEEVERAAAEASKCLDESSRMRSRLEVRGGNGIDVSALHDNAVSATPDSIQPLLESMAMAGLSRSQQDALLKDTKVSSGVSLQALRADLLSELKKAGVVKDAESASTALVNLAQEAGIELWHDQDKNPWATLRFEDHVEYHALKSRAVKRYLQGLYFEKTETSAHSEAIQSALGVLESMAVFKGKEHEVFVRVAEVDGAIYLDLCDESWRVARVTSDGVNTISMVDSPVRFRRSKGAKPLPLPADNADDADNEIPPGFLNIGLRYLPGLCALARQINVPTDSREWRLLVAWLLSLLRGKIPYPVLVLNGEQGSGKSTAARLLRSIVDPSTAPLRSLPRERRDLFIAAANSWVQCFDNVSGLPDWLSDDLCRLSTGGGLATRELYSDQEETILDAQRPCILNGITDFVVRQDLVDRAVLVTLPSIPDLDRKPEADLIAAFDDIRPLALGELLDIASSGLRRLPNTKLARMPRMADFALWVTACEEALGWESGSFAADFMEVRWEMISAALEAEPIVEPLRELASGLGWEGTTTELLERITEIAGLSGAKRLPEEWPKSARSLGRKLRRLAAALRGVGVLAKQLRVGHKRVRLWFIKEVPENNVRNVRNADLHEVYADVSADVADVSADVADNVEIRTSALKPAPDKAFVNADVADVIFRTQSSVSQNKVSDARVAKLEAPEDDSPEDFWNTHLTAAEREADVDEEDFPPAARNKKGFVE